MKKLASERRWLTISRKWWFIGGGIALLLLIIGAIGWSFYAWNDYRQQYISSHSELRQEATAAFAMKSVSVDEKRKKLAALSQLRQTIDEMKGQCDSYSIIHWQQFIGETKAWLEDCRTRSKATEAFGRDLKAVTDHIASEELIKSVLVKAAVTDKEVGEAAWPSIVEKWAKAHTDIHNLKVALTVQNTQKVIEEKIAALEAGWVALIAANTAKDRQKYDAALDQIETAHGAMVGISDITQKDMQMLIDKLKVSYKRVFS